MSEDTKILAEEIIDFCNNGEALFGKLRTKVEKLIGQSKSSPKLPFDVSKIRWEDRENEKGKFQMSEDYGNPEHKALLKFLDEHVPSKCVTSEGWFYWVYREGSKIGRKLKK
jgi:hypothetical protein